MYGDQKFFVSTIERDYDIAYAGGVIRGEETIVWEYDRLTRKRGSMVGQGGGLQDHFKICLSLHNTGLMPEED